MQYRAVAAFIAPGSIAEELGLEPGDIICTINGRRIADFLDYQFLTATPEILLRVQKKDGRLMEFEIENEELEDLGIGFHTMLFDPAKSCTNRCIFCFIDQLPPNMRKSLYFKDDDSRLSFLYGNYVTMTNMLPKDISRLIEYRISPVNISVHTTSPALRRKMLKNKHAGRILEYISRLAEGGITMNMQIVLCKGINDGPELDRTLSDLSAFYPAAASVSVVPVGLTDHRSGLYPLEPFSPEDARRVVAQIEAHQKNFLAQFGSRFVFLGDEFYLLAGLSMPPAEAYEDFPQIENGVGMEASMEEEFKAALEKGPALAFFGKTMIATGTLALPFIKNLLKMAKMRYPKLDADVVAIKNHLFGSGVSVAGLIGGNDLITQLSGLNFDRLIITRSMLKADEAVFLDNVTLESLEKTLGVPVETALNEGFDFLQTLLGAKAE